MPTTPRGNVIVLCDLIADLSLRISGFPVVAQDLQEVTYLELGPGGACNAAILVSRLGLPVLALGEVGRDEFGRVVIDGLLREGIQVDQIVRNPAGRTPVAGVLVDPASEPAYLGYAGALQIRSLPDAWRRPIRAAAALYADGWAEHEGVANIVLEALQIARAAGVPIFFDPGPGNPRLPDDNAWHREAAALATVVLVNEAEAARLTGMTDPEAAARALASLSATGDRIAVVKRGPDGAVLAKGDAVEVAPAYPVECVMRPARVTAWRLPSSTAICGGCRCPRWASWRTRRARRRCRSWAPDTTCPPPARFAQCWRRMVRM